MRSLSLGFLLVASTVAVADAPKQAIREVRFQIQHERDGKRYPNQVKETYALDKDGSLHYTAYFGGMPIDMNHMDSVDWKSGELGAKVLATAQRVGADLTEVPEGQQVPNGGVEIYIVGYDSTTRVAADRKGKAWAALDPAFQAMIKGFEADTKRPLKPGDLPQR